VSGAYEQCQALPAPSGSSTGACRSKSHSAGSDVRQLNAATCTHESNARARQDRPARLEVHHPFPPALAGSRPQPFGTVAPSPNIPHVDFHLLRHATLQEQPLGRRELGTGLSRRRTLPQALVPTLPNPQQDTSIPSPGTLPRPARRPSDLTRSDKGFGRSGEPNGGSPATSSKCRPQRRDFRCLRWIRLPGEFRCTVEGRLSSGRLVTPGSTTQAEPAVRLGLSRPVEQHVPRFQVTVNSFRPCGNATPFVGETLALFVSVAVRSPSPKASASDRPEQYRTQITAHAPSGSGRNNAKPVTRLGWFCFSSVCASSHTGIGPARMRPHKQFRRACPSGGRTAPPASSQGRLASSRFGSPAVSGTRTFCLPAPRSPSIRSISSHIHCASALRQTRCASSRRCLPAKAFGLVRPLLGLRLRSNAFGPASSRCRPRPKSAPLPRGRSSTRG
jgi:hypothetical protein